MEMVAGANVTTSHLFLRALRFCQYHGARDGDVCSIPNSDTGCRNTDVSGSAIVGLLFQPCCCTDSLWNHTRTDLLRRRLHHPTNLVGPGTTHIPDNDCSLERSRFHMVESFETL